MLVAKGDKAAMWRFQFLLCCLSKMSTSKTTSKVEVQVIDDKLLTECILQGTGVLESEANAINGLDFNLIEETPAVTDIALSFKKIGRIENLVGFDSLVKLCLDNNLIDEVINLSHLSKLKWLDLSFNKIRRIQGLECLTQLEDLSLFSNKISVIEGLDKCTNLQCLSLGNNRIDSLEQVIRLRQIRSLRMLTLSGNPVCNETEYKMMVLAYLYSLKYLDYALINTTERNIAKEQYHDELLDVEEKESVTNEKVSRDRAMEDYTKNLDDAGVIFSHTLFDNMFADDADIERLKHLPGIKELIDQFRSGFKALSDDFIKVALEKFDKKRKEINDFEKAVATVRVKDDAESTQLIEGFVKSKKTVVALLTVNNSTHTHHECQKMVKKLQDELERVCDELMSIELRQVEKFEGLIDEFDSRLVEVKAMALEIQQIFFRAVEELEDKFSTGMRLVVTDLIERLAREELAEDYLDDEAMSLVVDKDSCMGVLSSSHDLHIGRILKKEDEARSTETKRYQDLVHKHSGAERSRNRDRILQIHDFNRTSKSNLNALLSMDEDEGFDDEVDHGK